jgi:hypothetical protein
MPYPGALGIEGLKGTALRPYLDASYLVGVVKVKVKYLFSFFASGGRSPVFRVYSLKPMTNSAAVR